MCTKIGVIIISVKNAHIDPVTLTFDLSIPKPSFLGYLRSFPIPSLNTLRSFVFLSYAADKQTDRKINKKTEPNDSVSVGSLINVDFDPVKRKLR